MGSLLQCLFRICCDAQDEEDEASHQHDMVETTTATMSRGSEARQEQEGDGLMVVDGDNVGGGDDDDESSRGSNRCCRNDAHGLHDFFRRIRDRWNHDGFEHHYDIMRQASADDADAPQKKVVNYQLKQASSFDSSRGIPSISSEEIVMPGSKLQEEMAKLMKKANLQQKDDDCECVICMEGFDPTNPRMPTLCGCGENKTYFHLPCLFQWIEQSRECPSCRETLTWEEF